MILHTKFYVSLKQHNVCSLHKFEDHCEIAKHKIPTLSQLNNCHKTFFLSILRCRLLNLQSQLLFSDSTYAGLEPSVTVECVWRTQVRTQAKEQN